MINDGVDKDNKKAVEVCPYGCIRQDHHIGWHLMNQHWCPLRCVIYRHRLQYKCSCCGG